MKKELKLAVSAKLYSVMTHHGSEYYIEISFPGWVMKYHVQENEEEKVKKMFEDSQWQTIEELEAKGLI